MHESVLTLHTVLIEVRCASPHFAISVRLSKKPKQSLSYDTIENKLEKIQNQLEPIIQKQRDKIKELEKQINETKDFTRDVKGLKRTIKALSNYINPFYRESPPYYYGKTRWIKTTNNKMQLTYIDTKTAYMKEFLKNPITFKEFEENHWDYEGELAKFSAVALVYANNSLVVVVSVA